MPNRTKKLLHRLYYQHGLFTFLLMFVPVIPGIVESHTKTYIRLLRLFAGEYQDAREAVRVIFGLRGLKIYEHYIASHPDIIRPGEILRAYYQHNNRGLTINLLEKCLTNSHQRLHPLSHQFRIAILKEIPFIIQTSYQAFESPVFRDALARLCLNNLKHEQAPDARLQNLDTLSKLHHLGLTTTRSLSMKYLNTQISLLEASLKAKLTPHASIYSMPLETTPARKSHPELFSLSIQTSLNSIFKTATIQQTNPSPHYHQIPVQYP